MNWAFSWSSVPRVEAGTEIVDRARAVLRDVEQIKEVARRTRDPEAGAIRLGVFPTLGPYLLPHIVPEINHQYPKLELLLIEDKTEQLLNLLRDGEIDAALLALPVDDERLITEALFDEPFVVALPPDHPLGKRRTLDMTDLRDHTMLLLEDGHCLRDQALDVCQMASANERPGFRATSLETLRQMVATGVGATLLPTLATKQPESGNNSLVIRKFKGTAPGRTIGLVWRRSSAVGSFLQRIGEVIKKLPKHLLKP